MPNASLASLAMIGAALGLWGAAGLKRSKAARSAALPAATVAFVDFEHQIQPIIADNCLECHSQDRRKGGLSLATYGDILDGGRNGAVVRPGNSANSLILDRVTGRTEPQMPKDNIPLTAPEIALIRLWIDQGARATPTSAPAPPPWEAPLALSRPPVPPVTWAKWSSP